MEQNKYKISNSYLLLSLMLITWFSNAFCQNQNKLFRMGYSVASFQEVNPTDAAAAISVYVASFRKNAEKLINKNITFDYAVYSSMEEIKKALDKNEVNLLSLAISDYYELKKSYKLIPFVSTSNSDDAFEQYCIISRKDLHLNNVKDLIQKKISLPQFQNHPLLAEWLNSLVAENNLPSLQKMFGSLVFCEKESNTIYDVFFQRSDCAVTRKSVYDVACELNPQIKNQCEVIIFSPLMILQISVLSENTDNDLKKMIRDVTQNLQYTPEGQNILRIFKAKKFIDLKEADLNSSLDLIKKFRNKSNPQLKGIKANNELRKR